MAALLARRLGCRNLLSLCNLITVGCLLAMPAAAGSVRALSLITTLQGFVGAAMLPVCAMMKTHWLPSTLPAAERSVAYVVKAYQRQVVAARRWYYFCLERGELIYQLRFYAGEDAFYADPDVGVTFCGQAGDSHS